MMQRNRGVLLALFAALVACNASLAEDWPTYRHDNRRSGVTTERLDFPLRQTWLRRSKHRPQMAWTGPAKWDAYSTNSGLQSMRNFDPCFYVTAENGLVFFGSSVDDAVHALDAATGDEQWVCFTDSAVRLPPTLDSGRAYFGSDDGHVYCCDQQTGNVVWKRSASPNNRHITSNRKIISMWPVRTTVMLRGGTASFAASLVPWEPSYLWSVDASDGSVDGDGCFQRDLSGVTLQGALLASSKRIYVPQGRAAPLTFDIDNGKPLGAIGEAGGVFCVLTEDEMLLAGPQHQRANDDQVRVATADDRQHVATFSGANRILVDGDDAWVPIADQLKRLSRSQYVQAQIDAATNRQILGDKKVTDGNIKEKAKEALNEATKRQAAAWRWEVACPPPSGLIKTANSIIVGLDHEVRAYDAESGKLQWSHDVEGVAHGLAVAQGRLFVSTGQGHIYAFSAR